MAGVSRQINRLLPWGYRDLFRKAHVTAIELAVDINNMGVEEATQFVIHEQAGVDYCFEGIGETDEDTPLAPHIGKVLQVRIALPDAFCPLSKLKKGDNPFTAIEMPLDQDATAQKVWWDPDKIWKGLPAAIRAITRP